MLNISRVTLGYGGRKLLKLDKFHLTAGGQFLITGTSGSGKTTLLHAIAGLLPVMEGTIVIDGVDITRLSQRARDRFRGRRLGVIFQTLHLLPSLSVMDNLLLGLYAAGLKQDRARAAELLRHLGLYEKRNVLPRTLSQGQAQRVAIARSILHRPALILADEPTSSLDDENCEMVTQLIREAAQECGAALLLCTHDSRVKAHFPKVLHLRANK